jgi:Recombination endonuclease VII
MARVSKFLGKKKIGSYRGVKCATEGCSTQARKNGLCDKHYATSKRTPEWAAARRAKDLAAQEKAMGRPRPEFCEICGGPPNDRWGVLHFDHDHATGKPRGWICRNCNVMLGLARDSVDIFLDLASYLEKSHSSNF